MTVATTHQQDNTGCILVSKMVRRPIFSRVVRTTTPKTCQDSHSPPLPVWITQRRKNLRVTHEYRTNHRHSLLPVKHRLQRNSGRRKDVFLSLSFSSLSLHSLQQNVRGCRSHVQRVPRRCRSRCPPALLTHVSLRTAGFLIAHIHEIERGGGVSARTSTAPKIGLRSKKGRQGVIARREKGRERER